MTETFLSQFSDQPNQSSGPRMGINQLINEKEIIAASKNDPNCFKPLYEYYYRSILQYILHRTNDIEDAADIASSVFYKALLNLKKYRDLSLPFGAWLFRIARNETMQHFRKKKKWRYVVLDNALLQNLTEELETDNKETLLKATLMIIQSLDPDEIEILDLKYFQQKSYKEIAYILNASEGNLKVKTFRLLHKIRKKIDQQDGAL